MFLRAHALHKNGARHENRLNEKEQPRRAEMKIKLRFKQRKDQMLSLLFKKDFSQTTEINETFS